MLISRRQFLKYCSVAAGALGLTATDLMKLEKAMAYDGGLPVIWIAGQACTGCSTSLLNSVYYQTIYELLLTGTPSQTLDLKMHETVMAAMSNEATQQAGLTSSPFALVVEGSIPADGTNNPKDGYCMIGSYSGAASENVGDIVKSLADNANCAAILTVGTCSSYGGIPAAAGNLTGARSVLSYLGSSYRSKIISIPGCPPNPNWIVGTVAYLLANGLSIPALDTLRRPRMYYGERICNNCSRFTNNKDNFVGAVSGNLKVTLPNQMGSPTLNIDGGYCLKKAGCKGSRTKSDCSLRKWNGSGFSQTGVNWCVGAGAPCQGCTQNYFPDRMSPFFYLP